MTEHDELIRCVCLAPDDDLPRLIYADWCDEQGETERAEFIRVQVEKVQVYQGRPKGIMSPYVDTHSWKVRFEDLQQRERELLDQHGYDWFLDFIRDSGIPSAAVGLDRNVWKLRQVPKGLGWCEFRRGFVERVTCTATQWLTHGPAIVRQRPIMRVVLSDLEPSLTYAGGRYIWYLGPLADGPDRVPLRWYSPSVQATFDTPQAAKNALGESALLWARQEAGLEGDE